LRASAAQAARRARRQGRDPYHPRRRISVGRGKAQVISFNSTSFKSISFKSIFSRIIFLHVIALVVTAIFLPLALYWFVKSATDDLHDQAMREQADLLARYLVLRPDGSFALELPPALQDFYSQAYGRYAFAVLDDGGRVLFSSRKDQNAIFAPDPR